MTKQTQPKYLLAGFPLGISVLQVLASAVPTLYIVGTDTIAHAEAVTPWGVARTIKPDVPAASDTSSPMVPPSMPSSGIGAVMGPGSALRLGGAAPSAPAISLPAPRLPELSVAPVSPELNPLAETLASLKAVRERPLFSPSRRPPRAAPPPVVQMVMPTKVPPPSAPDLHLIGVVENPESVAGLIRRGNGPTLTVRAGDPIDGWTVSEIGPEHLTLHLGEQNQTYRLFAVGVPTGQRTRAIPPGSNR